MLVLRFCSVVVETYITTNIQKVLSIYLLANDH